MLIFVKAHALEFHRFTIERHSSIELDFTNAKRSHVIIYGDSCDENVQ